MAKLGDYDRWFKPCENCGHDSGRKSEKCKAKCWKCGRRMQRDYSERALKKNRAICQQEWWTDVDYPEHIDKKAT